MQAITVKLAFHDTDSDSPDTPTDPREEVGVGVVQCELYCAKYRLLRSHELVYGCVVLVGTAADCSPRCSNMIMYATLLFLFIQTLACIITVSLYRARSDLTVGPANPDPEQKTSNFLSLSACKFVHRCKKRFFYVF